MTTIRIFAFAAIACLLLATPAEAHRHSRGGFHSLRRDMPYFRHGDWISHRRGYRR
jgi:hypothetical protein